jgi:hypothetical protein
MTYNVVPIQIVENVHDNKHRKQTNIDLANESPFGLLALLGVEASDISRSLFPRVGSVGIGHDDFYIVDVALIDPVLGVVGVSGRHSFGSVCEGSKQTRKKRVSQQGEEKKGQ